MKKFSNNHQYDEHMDKEVVPLCNAINSLSGLFTIESCCGHGKHPFMIWFKCDGTSMRGLFFLTRCMDRRYFKYGFEWNITLEVGDVIRDGILPTIFLISSKSMGKESYDEANDLVENMEYHLNHENFVKGFLDNTLDDFQIGS